MTGRLKQHHTFGDFTYWMILFAVPFFTALLSIFRYSAFWTVVYLLVSGAVAGLVMRHFCAHCPHYTRDAPTLKCMFFWGMPKFFRPRPGPLGPTDKFIALASAAVFTLFPLPWLLAQPGLLVIYALSSVGLVLTLVRYECLRCVYSSCPSNRATADFADQGDLEEE